MPALSYQKQFVTAVSIGLYNIWLYDFHNQKNYDGQPQAAMKAFKRYCNSIHAKPEFEVLQAMTAAIQKRQTIRALRKREFKVGDTLYHYSGLRTGHCRKIGESICKEVHSILIDEGGILYKDDFVLDDFQQNNLAVSDGFKDYYVMLEWFEKAHGFPFNGQLIKW